MATGLEDQRPLNGVLTALASDVLGFCSPPHEAEDPLETRSVSGCSLCSPCSQEALTGSDAERTRLGRGARRPSALNAPEVDRQLKAPGCVTCYPRRPWKLGAYTRGPGPVIGWERREVCIWKGAQNFPAGTWLPQTSQREALCQQTCAQVAAFATRREWWVQGGEAGERP